MKKTVVDMNVRTENDTKSPGQARVIALTLSRMVCLEQGPWNFIPRDLATGVIGAISSYGMPVRIFGLAFRAVRCISRVQLSDTV